MQAKKIARIGLLVLVCAALVLPGGSAKYIVAAPPKTVTVVWASESHLDGNDWNTGLHAADVTIRTAGYYGVIARGADGGSGSSHNTNTRTPGGSHGVGGFVTGVIWLGAGSVYVEAGCVGYNGGPAIGAASGGAPGGGNGYGYNSVDGGGGGGGGGYSGIFTDNTRATPLVIAGGGGGGGCGAPGSGGSVNSGGNGGSMDGPGTKNGGASASPGVDQNVGDATAQRGRGGTGTGGGAGGSDVGSTEVLGQDGSSLQGGNAPTSTNSGTCWAGGGGGGFFGGGSGSQTKYNYNWGDGGGGGGSSYLITNNGKASLGFAACRTDIQTYLNACMRTLSGFMGHSDKGPDETVLPGYVVLIYLGPNEPVGDYFFLN